MEQVSLGEVARPDDRGPGEAIVARGGDRRALRSLYNVFHR